MERHDAYYRQYVQILREELRPATGCTEPIAIAYAAAKARSVLGALPDRVLVEVSGNIIKNVKSVVVPHTGGLRGIPAAAAAGIVAGDAEAQLEVLSAMTEAQSAAISPFLKVVPVEVRHADTPYIFDIQVTVFHGPDSAQVRLVGHHTNVVSVRRDGQVLLEREISEGSGSLTDRSCLTVEGIVAFADCLSTEDVEEVLEQQIRCNMAIAEEGLRHDYGANIGKTLLRGHEEDLSYRMRAYAAAASDARMNGCEMPVVINSGSGNQGITSSVPVIVCARATGRSHEELLRALAVANLVTIHLKTGIGRLSAYCGAVSAGCGAAAGLAYLQGGDYDTVILDVMMPGLNGLEVLRRLREEGVKTPVMMLTARGEKDDRITGFDAGADDYLPKPFEPDELIARVRAMLRRGGEYRPQRLTVGDLSMECGSGMLCGSVLLLRRCRRCACASGGIG